MMSERCAICDHDNNLRTLCDFHHWLTVIKRRVDEGTISDWPHVYHSLVMRSQEIADDRAMTYDALDAQMGGTGLAREIRRWAEEGAVLEQAGATYDTSGRESPGDGLWRERRIVAHWIRDALERVMRERDDRRKAA